MKVQRLSRSKITSIMLITGFVLCIGFFLLSYIQKVRADDQQRLAVDCHQEAEQQRQIAEHYRFEIQRVRQELAACSTK
jgi:hypothetical protein